MLSVSRSRSPATSLLSLLYYRSQAGREGGRRKGGSRSVKQQFSNRNISSNIWNIAQELAFAALTDCKGLTNSVFPAYQSWKRGEGPGGSGESYSPSFLVQEIKHGRRRNRNKVITVQTSFRDAKRYEGPRKDSKDIPYAITRPYSAGIVCIWYSHKNIHSQYSNAETSTAETTHNNSWESHHWNTNTSAEMLPAYTHLV